jgi:hypothetical protein
MEADALRWVEGNGGSEERGVGCVDVGEGVG